ncbi:MAG: 30S ribosomal protein S12 methylthiotransferase RimO [Clostridiales bacterium]|nr:30S ribosomal protein S12 methylthiotransferase RimO [Clostridiales bacterium]MBS5877225.1 30S ribosomal protein S12 methylthiotransferase RimO [Clostridiales bacterium]MDU0938935.1 30S ribosomal protein S12 methylthiotransferase RimO [Clostridiales bacterium]MDU1041930.1 30S ribosomal protein S12 methylthiotransferase RimO [Clostridiales bacterium]MDU3490429.1 30S ribosomal protein S12 methylthiotransferase RimO [Clostridiales bacterium]
MKILFISLGCDKNLVDTEEMLGLLGDEGFSFTDNDYEAEVVIINSCCFIHDAKTESIETILEMAQLKKTGVCRSLIVTGCLSQRYKDEILKEIPEIDAIVGTSSIDRIAEAVRETTKEHRENIPLSIMNDINRLPLIPNERISTTGGWYSYLKIAEGCDKHCTYCIIPKVRGRYRSMPFDFILERAKELVAAGTRELILVAQDVTLYGKDTGAKKKLLPSLIKSLAAIPELKWIRLLYCYPEDITDELIDVIKNEPKVCHYIDMPCQSASDGILKLMGRRTSRDDLRKMVSKLKREIPDICIRTTFITGFPGETDYDQKLVTEFIEESEFDRLGVFTYSMEENTPAARLTKQIDEDLKEARKEEIMLIQQEISARKSAEFTGKKLEVIIDGYLPEDDVYVGRSYRDAPNVDGSVFITLGPYSSRDIMSGTFVDVEITGSTEYDLIGRLIEE